MKDIMLGEHEGDEYLKGIQESKSIGYKDLSEVEKEVNIKMVKSPKKLNNMRCYLCGAMSFAPDNGIEWRQSITVFLKELGVMVIDPTNKPFDFGREDVEDVDEIKRLLETENYDQLASNMKMIRVVDLRSVDITDFVIVNIDITKYTTGTWEEITLANRQKKPVVVHVEQGKKNAPPWLFGMIPHQMIFSNWSRVKRYLLDVNNGLSRPYDRKRWMFFQL